MKRFALMLLLGLVGGSLFAQSVIASTSWSAAFARLAGADDVHVLAPFDMTHPPEYELRPSDIRLLMQADLVIYAGYETMTERLLATVRDSDKSAVQIATVHSAQVLRASVGRIAEALGTEEIAATRLAELFAVLDDWSLEVAGFGFDEKPVIVHFHQQALARELGMNVVGVFGPTPLEARQIDDLSRMRPALIVDNGHNPIAGPLAETTDAVITVWYNFPGIEGTRTLFEIFELNREDLRSRLPGG